MTRPQGAGLDAPAFAYVSTELDAMAAADNYRRGIMRYFAPYLGRRIIEVGAGMGAFSRSLLRDAQPDELVLVEPADNLAPRLARDFAGDPRVTVVHGYLDRLHGRPPVDSVILVNVLEHIRNDAGALRAIRDLLLPRGTLLLFVPAWPFLYGSMDRAFGHLRRYTKPVLAGLLAEAGYEIVQLRYFNLLGIAPWFFTGRLLRRETLRMKEVERFDRWVLPGLLKLERLCEPPIGLSLLAVARKPAG